MTRLHLDRDDALLAAANMGALLTLVPVAAHQLGLLDHLPDPPGTLFDSDRITESEMAHPVGVPDSLPGLASYGLTLSLLLLSRTQPAARRLLAYKLVADGGVAAFNVVRQAAKFRKICSWCTGTAACTAIMVYAGRKHIAAQMRRHL